jgi:hypothetical protein
MLILLYFKCKESSEAEENQPILTTAESKKNEIKSTAQVFFL